MIIIGVLLVVAVLLDGYRRMRSEQQSNLRMSLKDGEREDDEPLNPELPGGGARVVAVRDVPTPRPVKRTLPSGETPVAMDTDPDPDEWPEEQPAESFEGSYEEGLEQRSEDAPQPEPEPELEPELRVQSPQQQGGFFAGQEEEQVPGQVPERVAHAPEERFEPEPMVASRDDAIVPEAIEPEAEPEAEEPEPPGRFERLKQRMSGHDSRDKAKQAEDKDAKKGPTELIVLNVVAPQGTVFSGEDLLQILLACDVRLGKMNIFHRYEAAGGKGPEQFSVVNLVEPGTFDLDDLAGFSTPGVGFFMHLPGPTKPLEAFAAMAETAKVLAKNLGGELRDERHSAATTQTIEHYRQRILDFERRQLTLV